MSSGRSKPDGQAHTVTHTGLHKARKHYRQKAVQAGRQKALHAKRTTGIGRKALQT